MDPKAWIVIGGLLGGLGVAIGAFGAHGLEARLKPAETATQAERDLSARRLHSFEVGVRYQMYHALALVLLGLVARQGTSPLYSAAAWAFLAGIAIFSGCLYAWVLTQQRPFAMIVPIGGVAFIVGWVLLAIGAMQTLAPARG